MIDAGLTIPHEVCESLVEQYPPCPQAGPTSNSSHAASDALTWRRHVRKLSCWGSQLLGIRFGLSPATEPLGLSCQVPGIEPE
jgi:hypothetical protein